MLKYMLSTKDFLHYSLYGMCDRSSGSKEALRINCFHKLTSVKYIFSQVICKNKDVIYHLLLPFFNISSI